MLKYIYLHCFSILLDHAYINKHDLILKLIICGLFCKLLLYVLKILLNCKSVTQIYKFLNSEKNYDLSSDKKSSHDKCQCNY